MSDSEYETYLSSDVMEHDSKSNRKPTLPVPRKRKSTKQKFTHPSKTSKSDVDIFGISRKHNNGKATANSETSSLPSYFVNRVANGSERRTTSTNGEYYIDCKVYKTEDARVTDSLELWKKAMVRIKVQTDVNSIQWRKLQEFIISTDALFPEPPTYYDK